MACRPACSFYLGLPIYWQSKSRWNVSLHLARSSTTSIPQTKITYSFVYPVHIKTNVASSIFSEQRGKKNQIPLKICGIKQKYVPPILGFYKSFVKDKITLVYSSKNILSIVHPLDRYQWGTPTWTTDNHGQQLYHNYVTTYNSRLYIKPMQTTTSSRLQISCTTDS